MSDSGFEELRFGPGAALDWWCDLGLRSGPHSPGGVPAWQRATVAFGKSPCSGVGGGALQLPSMYDLTQGLRSSDPGNRPSLGGATRSLQDIGPREADGNLRTQEELPGEIGHDCTLGKASQRGTNRRQGI